jgi:uncharacterized protein (DUF58 family)
LARTWPRGKDRSDPVTWIWKAFRERTTPAGKTLAGIWLALLPISVLTRGAFGGAALAMVSAVLVAAWTWTLRSPRLSASAVLPTRMREGETVSVQVSIHGREGGLPPGAGAWIFRTGDGLEALGDGVLAAPGGSGVGTVTVPLRALKRGLQVVDGPSVLCHEPLGLFRSRALRSARTEVLVLPRAFRVVSLENLLRGPGGASFARALEAVAGDEEFAGIRPWRDGDNLRSVHHRAWARTGKPAVRETEREVGGGVVLAFSSACEGWARRSLLDPAISLAAALARFLSERDSLAGFLLDGAELSLPRSDRAGGVESALARLPGSAVWERRSRRPSTETPRANHSEQPVLSVGFSRAFPERRQDGPETVGLWVDWGGGAEPPPWIQRVDPDRILSGEARL